MILTVLRLNWLNLLRDRIAWLLSFVVPVVFFSIFAVVMGGMGGKSGGMPQIRVAVVDEDGTDFSKRLVTALTQEKSLNVITQRQMDGGPTPLTRADAEALVRNGKVPAAIILPKGVSPAFMQVDKKSPPIEVLADTSNQVASQMIAGLLQKVVMTGAPDVFLKDGIDQFEKHAGGLTEPQRKAIDQWLPMLKDLGAKKPGDAKEGAEPAAAEFGIVPVKIVDLLGETKENPVIAFYAAATAVMFLLFACANGGGGSLLEEVESGTLDRLLSSRLGMTQLLLGKWLWFTLMGVAQVTIMFLWGALVFKVDLFGHLPGFAVMAVTTAAAGSAFGLVLGTLCRSRGQLAGVSTTVILIMSALGGSMFPRFLMGPTLQQIGLFTFNAWALDGFQKVFWYEAPVWDLWPQAGVLTGLAIVFLVAARFLARRWETT